MSFLHSFSFSNRLQRAMAQVQAQAKFPFRTDRIASLLPFVIFGAVLQFLGSHRGITCVSKYWHHNIWRPEMRKLM